MEKAVLSQVRRLPSRRNPRLLEFPQRPTERLLSSYDDSVQILLSRLLPRSAAGIVAGAILLLMVAGTIGVLAVDNRMYAIMAGVAVIAVGLAAVDLGLVAALSVPATLVMERVGGFLSVSDVVLAAATVIGLMLISWREAHELKGLVWLGVIYQAALVPTLVLNPYSANLIEWVHEGVLIIGSLIVGWVIGRRGLVRVALGLYVFGCCGIAVVALAVALIGVAHGEGWQPVYLPYMHKNFIGDSLAAAMVILYARPDWAGLSRRWSYLAMTVCAAGIAASMSRQAIVSAAVGLAVVSLRPRADAGRRSRLVWFALIPATIFVVGAVIGQLRSTNHFNSTYQRLAWFGQSVDIWMHSPLFGVGLRWWYTTRFDVSFQPPNAEFEMLTSAGIVGLLAFLALFTGAAWLLVMMDPRYGTVALAVVVTRFTQGQLDLYWVAGQASFLWIIAGLAYGIQVRDRALASSVGEALEAPPIRTPIRARSASRPTRRARAIPRRMVQGYFPEAPDDTADSARARRSTPSTAGSGRIVR